jgi:hypothetical protein
MSLTRVTSSSMRLPTSPACRRYWAVVLALICQAVVAAVTVAVTSDAAVVHGLFAAALTGLGGVAALVTHPTIGRCVDVVSLRGAGVALAVKALARRRRGVVAAVPYPE